jgi:hypothetical protein
MAPRGSALPSGAVPPHPFHADPSLIAETIRELSHVMLQVSEVHELVFELGIGYQSNPLSSLSKSSTSTNRSQKSQ